MIGRSHHDSIVTLIVRHLTAIGATASSRIGSHLVRLKAAKRHLSLSQRRHCIKLRKFDEPTSFRNRKSNDHQCKRVSLMVLPQIVKVLPSRRQSLSLFAGEQATVIRRRQFSNVLSLQLCDSSARYYRDVYPAILIRTINSYIYQSFHVDK